MSAVPTTADEKKQSKAEKKARRAAQVAARSGQLVESKPNELSQQSTEASTQKQSQPSQKSSETPKPNQPITKQTEYPSEQIRVDLAFKRRLTSRELPPRSQIADKVSLFSHLQQPRAMSVEDAVLSASPFVHPSFVELALKVGHFHVVGGTARGVGLIAALKDLIASFETRADFSRELASEISHNVAFLQRARPLSASQEAVVKFVRAQLQSVHSTSELCALLDDFFDVRFVKADRNICQFAGHKVCSRDVVLTFGHSAILLNVFATRWRTAADFRVLVVDCAPMYEGKVMVAKLVALGLPAEYVPLSSLTARVHEVTKCIVSASALMLNGAVVSRVGQSAVCLLASRHHIPVLVCCQSYKFTERVQNDAVVLNELVDPTSWRSPGDSRSPNPSQPTSLRLMYDVTQADLVTAVVCEFAIVPTTSIPVVLRLKDSIPI